MLKIHPLGYNEPNSEMPYSDFFIRYEHKFLRNIYSDSEIAELQQICTLQNYYVVYQKFIKICINLLALLGGLHVTKDEDQFETDLEELRWKIDNVEIKKLFSAQTATRFLDLT